MSSRNLMGGSLAAFAAAGAMLLAATTGQAAILPASPGAYSAPVHLAWCAIGAHIGPLGACVGGPGWGPGYYHHCWHNRWGQRICN